MDYRNRRRMREETASMDQRTNKEKYGVDSILPEGDEWEYLPPVVEGMFKKFGNIVEASKKDAAGRTALREGAKRPVREMADRYMDARFDSRASFGRKAVIDTRDNGVQFCKSYGTTVVKYDPSKSSPDDVVFYPEWDYSQTTVRHVKEFLRQNHLGMLVGTRSEMANNPDITFADHSYEE